MMKREIGEKGQIVVPKDIRDHLGLRPGSDVMFEIREHEVVLRRAPTDPHEFVNDFCTVPVKLKKKVDIKRIIEMETEEKHVLHRR